MTQMQVPALDVDSLAQEYGVPDLDARLRANGVQVISFDGHQVILQDAWRALLATCLKQLATEPPVANGRVSADAPKATGHGQETAQWKDTIQARLKRYPLMADLLVKFRHYMEQNEPGVQFLQNLTTLTLVLSNGRQAGLKPKVTRGLRLHAIVKGQTVPHWMQTEADFAGGLDWLRKLPPYA